MAGAGTVIIPWYATGLRIPAFVDAVEELARASLRYGASSYAVYQSEDDRYRIQQQCSFPDHLYWERYWEGPEATVFRTRYAGWFQIPLLYSWWEERARGAIEEPLAETVSAADGESGE
jgi:hypothetical protein